MRLELVPKSVSGAGPAREQPHVVLGPTGTCHGRRPCGAPWGGPFAATRYRILKPVLGVCLSTTVLLSAAQQTSAQNRPAPPQTTFKSSVDLVPVDVNVIDRTGRPIADLTAQDFALKVDGKPRRIASAQFIGVTRDAEYAPIAADYSSNPSGAGARLIMLVIDQGNIGASRGKYAIDSARRFIGRLRSSDRIGLVTIPGAGPQIDFTANHALVETALQKVIGQSDQGEHQDNQVGLSEAIEAQRGNEQAILELMDRECTGLAAGDLLQCRTKLLNQARTLYADLKSRTRDTLLSLQHVMDRLARTSTPKTVVFVSEGILIERDVSELTWLGPLAARGQVTLYVLQLEAPVAEATNQQSSPTRAADIQLAQDGLGRLAGVARGAVFRVISGAENAFNRLTLELSGYYLLSFEPEGGDRDSKTHKIKIEVPRRKDVSVRARNEFSVDAPRVRSTGEQLADVIAAPLLATEIGLKVGAYSFVENEGGKLRIVLAAEIDRSQNPGSKVSLAYTVTDANETLVSTQLEEEVTTPVRPATKTQTYLGAITAVPGTYRIKLAVLDDMGKRGSVEHIVVARLTGAGQIRLTDLLLGEDSEGTGLHPSVSAEFNGGLMHGYLELHSEAPGPLADASVTLEIANSAQARAIDTVPAQFEREAIPSPTRRLAEGVIPIALLPAGEYVARAVVTVAGRNVGQVSRPFRIVRSGAAASTEAAAAGGGLAPKPAIPFTSRIESFERASVLAPQVVGFFLDRMNVGRNVPTTPSAAIDAARAGKFEEAIEAVKKTGNNQLAPVFFDGLARYAKGDLEGAAGRFRESLRIESDFFPATFYLGACYAAGGKDQDATGAWQTSLITESEAPFIYTLLGDAFLRLRQFDAALDILREASSLWPASEQVQLRLGTAYALASKPVEAVRALDSYLAQHPEDHERLLIALRGIYEARSTGQSIGTADEDRRRFERYAAAYVAAGGAQQAIVEQWRRFIAR
jgi:VWFA-related protein